MAERHVTYEQTLSVPRDAAWKVLGDYGSLLNWVVGGDEGSLQLTGEGVGQLRDLNLPSVGHVQHRLDAHDETRHLITYSLTKGRPLGMQAYAVTVWLEASADGTCIIKWEGVFTPDPDADADAMADNLRNAYVGMSARLDAFVAGS